MTRPLLIIALVLAFMAPQQAEAQGSIVVGVEPAMYDTVVAGVQGWNAAGLGFVVQPTGCGTGDVTFCYSADPWSAGGDESWIAWWPIGSNTIMVSTVSPYAFTPAVACHELGHWLGLHYHRSDGMSCMTNPTSGVASPDYTDLANLGLSWVSPPAAEPAPEPAPVADAQVVTELPKTGTGIHAVRWTE